MDKVHKDKEDEDEDSEYSNSADTMASNSLISKKEKQAGGSSNMDKLTQVFIKCCGFYKLTQVFIKCCRFYKLGQVFIN